MIKEEWKSLFRNKILLLVVLVIALIPVIYAGLFLASMWDPYGNVDKLPVAVVNEDCPAEYRDVTLAVGDELVEKLREDGSMAFHFVDQRTADEGLKKGIYYMAITIPKDFSANAATVMDDHPRKMQLNYKINPGTNYIASKLSETGMEKIRTSVAEEVTETYTEVIFDQIDAAGEGMQKAADGAGQIKEGVKDASAGNKTISDNLKKLADSTLTFQNGTEELTEGIGAYTAGVNQLHEGAGQLNRGVSSLTDGLPDLLNGTGTLNQGVQDYTAGVSRLYDHSRELTEGSSQAADGTQALAQGAAALEDGAREYMAGVTRLTDGLLGTEKTVGYVEGVKQLTDGLLGDGTKTNPGYIQGVEQLEKGVLQLSGLENLGQIHSAVIQLENAVSGEKEGTLEQGARELTFSLKSISDQAALLETSADAKEMQTLFQKIAETQNEMLTAGQVMETVSEGMEESSETIAAAAKLCDMTAEDVDGWGENLSESQRQYSGVTSDAVSEGNDKIARVNRRLADGHMAFQSAAEKLLDISAASSDDGTVTVSAEVLNQLADSLNAAGDSLAEEELLNAGDYESRVGQISDQINGDMQTERETALLAAKELNQMTEGLKHEAQSIESEKLHMKDSAEEMKERAAAVPAGFSQDSLKELCEDLKKAYQGSAALLKGIQQTGNGLDQLEKGTASFPQAAAGIQALKEGFNTLTEKDTILSEGARKLQSSAAAISAGAKQLKFHGDDFMKGVSQAAVGVQELADGMKRLDSGIIDYTDGVKKLDQNSRKLKEGSQSLADGAGVLGDGALKLKEGTNSLYEGTGELTAGSIRLNDGAARLSGGAQQIHIGAKQLQEGSQELGTGLGKLYSGSDTLKNSLADGARQINDNTVREDNIKMISAPVDSRESKMTDVPNNGHAMAPYMMSVGLWVGSLAFCLMYPLTEYQGKLKSGFAWWMSKASVLCPLALLQGALLIWLLHILDGFAPEQMGKAILFSCLVSVAFTSIMYFFNVCLGKVGSFLMLIFMVVQLAGSAGTYPVELSPGFVARIHNLVPFTYTVNAFRSVICAGESIAVPAAVMIALTLVFTLLTILLFDYRSKKIKRGERTVYDFLEKKGLA